MVFEEKLVVVSIMASQHGFEQVKFFCFFDLDGKNLTLRYLNEH
ncbi:hypothetical protein HMPREF9104_02164 [Lentilactobacillus kisonensis F0435]|uniref:Uncharacterized protein n=1 Tax=Lentilactobacillus kisonensis F0435 TaxID=797516 RepID=H1LHS3_9LACO|nr:hypothetical protein HMPREF9104_02164 [Lentilactobacillus kisonensis F0435]